MADIKSSLEIALARAASFASGTGREDEREGGKKGEFAVRALLAGDLGPEDMVRRLEGMEEGQRDHARRAAVDRLLEALLAGEPAALKGLEALTPAGAEAELMETARAFLDLVRAGTAEEAALAAEMGEGFREMGLTGSALLPNPRRHPACEERLAGARKRAGEPLRAAARRLGESLHRGW